MQTATAHPLTGLLAPSSIAVVGASSTRPFATGNQAVRNLVNNGFTGRIEVVSAAGGVVEGVTATTAISELDPTDTAIVAVGPKAVLGALRALHLVGVPTAIVMSVGLDDTQLQELAHFSSESGMLVHGPNCMGVINVPAQVMIWADEGILTQLPAGDVALVSQSGSGAIFVARSSGSIGFSHIVSTGNEAALGTAQYLDFLAEDPATNVIGLIIESISDAPAFAAAAMKARRAGKAVVALKVGRSAAGGLATVAHTGAVLADDAVLAGFFRKLQIPLVADYDELATTLEVLASLKGRSVGESRTAVVTISGGQAALAADIAESRGLPLADLAADTRARLAEILPGLDVNNPLDAGGSVYASEAAYGQALEILAQDENVDVVIAIIDSQSTLNDIEIQYEDDMVADVRAATSRTSTPFLIASSSSLSLHPSRIPPAGDSVAVVRGIGNAFSALNAASVAQRPSPAETERPASLPGGQELENLRLRLSQTHGILGLEQTHELLDVYGIGRVRSTSTSNLEDALIWAASEGYPVVMKIDSSDIAHRSDIGAVVVDIRDEDAARAAWATIHRNVRLHRPDARVSGIEVQTFIGQSVEAFIGAVSAPGVGTTVAIGLGGVLVELLRDSADALVPISEKTAQDLIASTRLDALLSGYRNLHPVVDRRNLVDTLVRLSWMLHDFSGIIAECDFNPVLIDPNTGRVSLIDTLTVLC